MASASRSGSGSGDSVNNFLRMGSPVKNKQKKTDPKQMKTDLSTPNPNADLDAFQGLNLLDFYHQYVHYAAMSLDLQKEKEMASASGSGDFVNNFLRMGSPVKKKSKKTDHKQMKTDLSAPKPNADLNAVRGLNLSDFNHQYVHYAAPDSLLKSKRLRQFDTLKHSEQIWIEKFINAERVMKEKTAEVEKLNKYMEDFDLLLKNSHAEVEKLKLQNAKLKKLQESFDSRLAAAHAQAVRDYKASADAEKDIEALAQPALRYGYNNAMEKVNELYPILNVLEDENFQYYPEEVAKFGIRLAQFKTTGDISEHWLENQTDIDLPPEAEGGN